MLMTLIIRKHSFTESIDSNYFGTFQNLLELDLGEDAVNSLFKFFELSQTLKVLTIASFNGADTTRMKLHKTETPSLYGFVSFGVLDLSIFFDRIQTMSEWQPFQESLTDLYDKLGWSLSEYKKVEVEVGEFNSDTGEHSLYPLSFDIIDNLWEQATPL